MPMPASRSRPQPQHTNYTSATIRSRRRAGGSAGPDRFKSGEVWILLQLTVRGATLPDGRGGCGLPAKDAVKWIPALSACRCCRCFCVLCCLVERLVLVLDKQ